MGNFPSKQLNFEEFLRRHHLRLQFPVEEHFATRACGRLGKLALCLWEKFRSLPGVLKLENHPFPDGFSMKKTLKKLWEEPHWWISYFNRLSIFPPVSIPRVRVYQARIPKKRAQTVQRTWEKYAKIYSTDSTTCPNCEDLKKKLRVQDLLDRIFVEAPMPMQDPFVRIYVEGHVQEILSRSPSSRSVWQVSVSDLHARSL